MSETPGYADRAVEIFDQLDMIDGRRRREKQHAKRGGRVGGGDKNAVPLPSSGDRKRKEVAGNREQQEKIDADAVDLGERDRGGASALSPREKRNDDDDDDDDDDDALDPDVFKTGQRKEHKATTKKTVSEKEPPKKKKKKKKVGDVAAVLNSDKADALSAW